MMTATTDPMRVPARAPNLAGNYLPPALAMPRRRTWHQEEWCGSSAGLRVEPAAASTHEPSQSSPPSVPPAQRRAARAHHALLAAAPPRPATGGVWRQRWPPRLASLPPTPRSPAAARTSSG
ncbi:hypothetical protein PVAP13_9KG207300 [Panicum virgatum]|uniref:Uncharacterized protein n=1 Tax=Panicum virgatum TaxID=38727 RepID=A0A8T0NHS6_PANVG|nr:hypothetical protein PVAP13_9KG207300 [Panicum virgatum]